MSYEKRKADRRVSQLWLWLKRKLGLEGVKERRQEERRKAEVVKGGPRC